MAAHLNTFDVKQIPWAACPHLSEDVWTGAGLGERRCELHNLDHIFVMQNVILATHLNQVQGHRRNGLHLKSFETVSNNYSIYRLSYTPKSTG